MAAARLRDEIKRLTAVELKIADDPFARQGAVDDATDAAIASGGPKQARGASGGYVKRKVGDRPGRPKTFGSRSRRDYNVRQTPHH
jgi:excinuclease ABC subunit B